MSTKQQTRELKHYFLTVLLQLRSKAEMYTHPHLLQNPLDLCKIQYSAGVNPPYYALKNYFNML